MDQNQEILILHRLLPSGCGGDLSYNLYGKYDPVVARSEFILTETNSLGLDCNKSEHVFRLVIYNFTNAADFQSVFERIRRITRYNSVYNNSSNNGDIESDSYDYDDIYDDVNEDGDKDSCTYGNEYVVFPNGEEYKMKFLMAYCAWPIDPGAIGAPASAWWKKIRD